MIDATTLIDRREELAALRRAAASPPALVVIRGRRRVGKSHLLRAAFAGERVVIMQADEQPERQQLDALARELSRQLPELAGIVADLPTWDAALEVVGRMADPPLVLILDEFQNLCASQPALPSIVQRHWDEWDRRRTPVVLVLCGSAISFMEGLLPSHAPLAGRATLRPLLGPLGYRDAAGFARPGTSPAHLVERYAVLGGTPQYQVWARHRDTRGIVREILTKGGPLYDEPMQLLRTEDSVRDPGRYLGVLSAVAAGHTQLNEIAQQLGHDTSNVLKVLQRLEELHYVELQQPVVLRPERRIRPWWQVRDPFFRFWFRHVFPNRSRLEWGRVDEVLDELMGSFDSYVGHVFEDCCREWLARYASIAEMRDFRAVGRWWSNTPQAEIDVAVASKQRYTVLGSCKWHRGPIGESMLDDLIEQRVHLGARAAQARLVLFARDGFRTAVRTRAEREGVHLVTAADLFA